MADEVRAGGDPRSIRVGFCFDRREYIVDDRIDFFITSAIGEKMKIPMSNLVVQQLTLCDTRARRGSAKESSISRLLDRQSAPRVGKRDQRLDESCCHLGI